MSPQDRPRPPRAASRRPTTDAHKVLGDGPATGPVSALGAGARFSTYEIESRLASGGMAEVWRAKITGFEKRIVIKTMLPQFQERPDLVAMFVSEASLAARLSHPNIVDVIDFGQLEGRYFIAMAYVPGVTLRFAQKRMQVRRERLPVAAVLHLARDVCEALEYLHELEDAEGPLGLLHRDLSPDNIVISTSGVAKLIDFGAARATARTPPPRLFVGKFRYASPERIRLDGEDARSDVYSLGIILYECLTGARAFPGSDPEVIEAVMASGGCDPRDHVPSLPASVAAVVRKATAQRPADRFTDARELGIALARCLAELGAGSKEREVTAVLATIVEEPAQAMPERRGEPDTVVAEVRDVWDGHDSRPGIVLNEAEIIEASGPIGAMAEAIPLIDTRRISLPVPPEAFRQPSDSPESRQPLERAVQYFDRGLELRLRGRYGEALAAWEKALSLAPANHLYEAHVRRLRDQLHARRGRR